MYTLNCESVATGGGTGAVAGGGSVLAEASIGVGAVDARIGGESGVGLLGVDICQSVSQALCGIRIKDRGYCTSARSTLFPCSFRVGASRTC